MEGSRRAAPVHVGVGIDTARYGHHVAFLGEDRQAVAKDFTFRESGQGYAELEAALRQIAQRRAAAVHFEVRIDAAGQYATNVEAFLRRLDLPMTISVGEPKRNRDYKNVHYPKRKDDVVDSRACARFAVIERPPASAAVPQAMRRLGEVTRAVSAQRKQTTRALNQLHNLLARVFPELATLISRLSTQWVLALLAKYPSAQRIAAARVGSLDAIAHLDAERAAQIHAAARTTTASLEGPVVEGLVLQAVHAVQHSQQAEHQLEDLLETAYDGLGAGGHQQLITIPGIGKKTAAALAGKIVSIDRFATPAQLVSYFGTFPEENTSGVDKYGNPLPKGTMQMSSQGNDLVRGLLWMACQAAIRCNPALRPLYARQRAAGKRGDVALGHCMRKLLHLVFALWKTNQPFDPAHYQWEAPPPQSEDAATTNPLDRAVDTPPRSATEGAATAPTDLATRNRSHAGQAGNAATLAAAEHCVVTIATSDPVVTPRPARRPAPTPSAAPAPPTKKAAGRTEAMPPRQAVTAAANELATRKIPPPREPSNRAPLTDGAARRPAPGVWVDLGHVRAQITMEQVLSNLGVLPRLRGHGPQRRGPCPIHGSEGRPFSVHLGKNVFRCLHVPCGTQGNVLDLWAAVRNLPLRDAAMDLAHTFQLQLAPNKRANR